MGKTYAAVGFKLLNLNKCRLQIFLSNEQFENTMCVGIRHIQNEIYIHKRLGSGRHSLKVGINNDEL